RGSSRARRADQQLSAAGDSAFPYFWTGAKGISVKDIRNAFAHSFHSLTFDRHEIANSCQQLRLPEIISKIRGIAPHYNRHKHDSRFLYHMTCMTISFALRGDGVNGPRPRRPRSGRKYLS
ncbi:MAG TPA: hypothetical protein VE631_04640, partial [Alphaproteobacteria bacterium]|nr:hypothetical protein [Alphaproteobacteria bacterium]